MKGVFEQVVEDDLLIVVCLIMVGLFAFTVTWWIIRQNITIVCKKCNNRFYNKTPCGLVENDKTRTKYIANRVEKTAYLSEAKYLDEIFKCPKCKTKHMMFTNRKTKYKQIGEEFDIQNCNKCDGKGYLVETKMDWNDLAETVMWTDNKHRIASSAIPKNKKIPCGNCDERGWVKN